MRRGPFAAVALAALIIGAVAAVPAGARGKPASHPSCSTLFSHAQIFGALGHVTQFPTVTPIKFGGATTGGEVGLFIGRTSVCAYNWVCNGATPLSVQLCETTQPALWGVGWGVSSKVWRKTRTHEFATPIEGTGPWTHRSLNLGHHSQAFVVTTTLDGSVSPPISTVYAYSRHHNLIRVSLWPASLSAVTGLVKHLLASGRI